MRFFSLLVLIISLGWAGQPAALAADAPSTDTVLVLGDSLSAAYNMPLESAWPRLLEQRLQSEGWDYQVVNASITGETTQGGRTRLPGLLQRHTPRWVIIELGGNDGLRGFSLDLTRDNLAHMVQLSQDAGAAVVLTEILLPPNYGASYTRRFTALYTELAETHDALLVPFFMDGVALVDGMMQADGIHPSEQAQPRLLDNVWRVFGPALQPEP